MDRCSVPLRSLRPSTLPGGLSPVVARSTADCGVEEGLALEPTSEPGRRRVDRKLLVASVAIAIGFVLIGVGLLRAVTGDDVTDLPDAIESISPAPDAEQVLQQTQVIVDLLEGYEGELTIDGVELTTFRLDELPVNVEPGQQIEVPPGAVFEPGNGTLSFAPGQGTGIDSFDPGRHTVTVTYWLTADGPDLAHTYGWTFDVV